jgi:hypothetical protein
VCIEGGVAPLIALVEAAREQRAEADVPGAVVDFLEAHVLVGERVAEVQPAALPSDAIVSADAPSLEVGGAREYRRRLGSARNENP